MTRRLCSETSLGPAHWWIDQAAEATGLLVLGPGAGGGPEARDLAHLAEVLPVHGWTVARLDQPWRVAGRKIAGTPKSLDQGLIETTAHLLGELGPVGRLVVGGRSAGARSACRSSHLIDGVRVVGVLALAFPLHPPGRPERTRREELLRPTVPCLVVQGERDSFGGPEEVTDAVAAAAGEHRVVGIPGADHGFAVPKKYGDAQTSLERISAATLTWLAELSGAHDVRE